MRAISRLLMSAMCAVAVTIGLLSAPASAGKPTVGIDDGRVSVTIPGKTPSKAKLVVAGSKYRLSRASGKVWRTKPLSADALAAIAGRNAKLKLRVGKNNKKKTLTTSVPSLAPTPPPPPPTPPPLFVAPGVDRTGNEAWEAVKGYFANSTVTNCPAGWPNCAVEERYGYFENGTHWYCRLTPNSGSDIRSVGSIQQIVGAEQKADGAWGVSFALDSYGDTVYYSVRVAADGSANVQYWGPGADTNGPPTSSNTGMVWMRGAKDCSY